MASRKTLASRLKLRRGRCNGGTEMLQPENRSRQTFLRDTGG